jgi:enoyl-CoA hydratase
MADAEGQQAHEPHLLSRNESGILVLTFNRTDKLNALSPELFDALASEVVRFRDDPALKVCLIRATGRYFCAGVDLKDRRGPKPSDSPEGSGIRLAHRIGGNGQSALCDEMEAIEKPFVVAHHAACLGGGLEISMSCDFRLAAQSARYGFPEGKFGALPATGGVSRLTRLVGTQWAKYLIMANREVDAARALAIGLVHEVWPDAEFDDAAMAFCRHLAEQNGEQMGAAKLAIEMARDLGLAQARNVERLANSALFLSPDQKQAMARHMATVGKPKP